MIIEALDDEPGEAAPRAAHVAGLDPRHAGSLQPSEQRLHAQAHPSRVHPVAARDEPHDSLLVERRSSHPRSLRD